MRSFLTAFLVCVVALNSFGATWYVEKGATGSNAGTSWANAWNEMDQISWGSISPGDTIYVGGGTYAKQLRVQASGTAGSLITIKASQEAGHNSMIIQTNSIGCFGSGNYWVIDGAKTDGIETSITNTFQTKTMLATNCNWQTWGVVCNGTGGGTNATIRWMNIGGNTNGVNDNWGILWSNGNTGNYKDTLEYCYIHDIEDSGIISATSKDPSLRNFDDLTVAWCYLTNSGDDFYEGVEGATIHNNYFDREGDRHGHPDGIAGHMGKRYVYNNVLVDIWDQIIYAKIWETYPDGNGEEYIYGNLIYVNQGANPPKADGIQNAASWGWETQRYTSGVGAQSGTTVTATSGTPFLGNGAVHVGSKVWWQTGESATITSLDSSTQATVTPSQTVASGNFQVTSIPPTNTVDGIVFANNTIVGDDTTTAGKLLNSVLLVSPYASAGFYFTNTVLIKNGVFKNNIFYKLPQGSAGLKGSPGSGFSYQDSDLAFDYNVGYSTLSAGKGITYLGTNFADAEALNAATIYTHNTSSAPSFTDASTFDFTLQASDTVARQQGVDLTSLGLPGWGTDLAGNSRTALGGVDIGALAVTNDPTLLVHIDWEDDFTTLGYSEDLSGNSRNAIEFTGATNGFVYITPEPIHAQSIDVTSIGGRTGSTGKGAALQWSTNNWGAFGKSGAFFGITNNIDALTNMSTATVMIWVRFKSWTNTPGATAWYSEGNQDILATSRSTGVAGTWSLGRYNDYSSVDQMRFLVRTNAAIYPEDSFLDYPDFSTATSSTGYTTNWNHYAVVWNNGKATNYLNGVAISSMDVSSLVTTLKIAQNGSGIGKWLGIGANPHGGTPELEDESGEDYPNNGWANADIDDLRIYNRVLSPTEIQSIITSDNGTVAGGGDVTSPIIAITSPSSSSTYDNGSTSTIDIGGTASDNVGVDHVTWANDRGGSGTATGTTSWSQSSITLYSGSNVLTVTAWDAAGNYGTDTLTVTYTPAASGTTGRNVIGHLNGATTLIGIGP